MAAESTLESLSNRLLNLDGLIEQQSIETDTFAFIDSMKNKNTKKKTKSDISRVKLWLESVGEHRELLEIPSEELNLLLAKCFMNLRKVKDGSEYEPDTIRSMQGSIHRYLQDNGYDGNILKDSVFKHFRDVIDSKRKLLKSHGKGNKKNRSDPFTNDEIEILKKNGLLGGETPDALSNTIWLNNMIHFGLRGRQEHVTMLWGDVELQTTSSGREYLAFTERLTKTRNGISSDSRDYVPKMFAQPGDKDCPVQMYKLYAEKRPAPMNTPDARFYAAVNPNFGNGMRNGDSWFMNAPMGKNKLGQIGKNIAEKAKLSGRHTNHSGRKTCVTTQMKNKVSPTDVAQLSGHKILMSLNTYNTVSLERQMEMSDISHSINKPSTSVSDTSNVSNDYGEMSDSELVAASQDIESALQTIESFETVVGDKSRVHDMQIVDIPVLHNTDGSFSVVNKIDPSRMFVNCTFTAHVCQLYFHCEYSNKINAIDNVEH